MGDYLACFRVSQVTAHGSRLERIATPCDLAHVQVAIRVTETLPVNDLGKAADCGDDGATWCSGCFELFEQTGGEVFAVAEPEYTELSRDGHDAGVRGLLD